MLWAASRRGCSQQPPPPDRIILIVVDTLRRDHVSAYAGMAAAGDPTGRPGSPGRAAAPPVKTPNIDRLASSGQVFTNAVSAFHATTMTMAALFTGLTPSIESGTDSQTIKWNSFVACGMSRFLAPDAVESCLPASLTTLAEDLQGAGYWTLGVVLNGLLYRPYGYDQGFDGWVEVGLDPPGRKRNIFESSAFRRATDVNRAVLNALAKRPSDRFFLYIHYLDVHDYSLFKQTYAASVERFDRHLGERLDQLTASGMLENATVILTADHGEMLTDQHLNLKTSRHFGNPAFEPVLRVPLIVTPPIDGDANRFVRSQDLIGMIRKIAGLDPLAAGELEPDELYLSEMFYQAYRKGRRKSNWSRSGKIRLLFDLEMDPDEENNLADDRPDIMKQHRERIDELSIQLATNFDQVPTLSEDDRRRLGELGYIDTTNESFQTRTSAPELPGTRSAGSSE
jgi:hypothetical protein